MGAPDGSGDTCELCGRSLTGWENASLRAGGKPAHHGHEIRRVPPDAAGRNLAEWLRRCRSR